MNAQSILAPLFKAIDRVIFGIDDLYEIEKPSDALVSDNESHFEEVIGVKKQLP